MIYNIPWDISIQELLSKFKKYSNFCNRTSHVAVAPSWSTIEDLWLPPDVLEYRKVNVSLLYYVVSQKFTFYPYLAS